MSAITVLQLEQQELKPICTAHMLCGTLLTVSHSSMSRPKVLRMPMLVGSHADAPHRQSGGAAVHPGPEMWCLAKAQLTVWNRGTKVWPTRLHTCFFANFWLFSWLRFWWFWKEFIMHLRSFKIAWLPVSLELGVLLNIASHQIPVTNRTQALLPNQPWLRYQGASVSNAAGRANTLLS